MHKPSIINIIYGSGTPPNKGHYGANDMSLIERSSLSWRSNSTLKYEHGVEISVLCREIVPFSSIPYQRFHCIATCDLISISRIHFCGRTKETFLA